MKSKQTFLMYKDWDLFINDLTDEQAGQLLKAIYAKQNGREADVTEEMKTLFSYILKKIDANEEKYLEICEKRRAAADAKWRKAEETKGMQKHANNANACKSMQMMHKYASVTDTVTGTGTDTVTVTGTGTDTGMDTDTGTDAIPHSIHEKILADLTEPKFIKLVR